MLDSFTHASSETADDASSVALRGAETRQLVEPLQVADVSGSLESNPAVAWVSPEPTPKYVPALLLPEVSTAVEPVSPSRYYESGASARTVLKYDVLAVSTDAGDVPRGERCFGVLVDEPGDLTPGKAVWPPPPLHAASMVAPTAINTAAIAYGIDAR